MSWNPLDLRFALNARLLNEEVPRSYFCSRKLLSFFAFLTSVGLAVMMFPSICMRGRGAQHIVAKDSTITAMSARLLPQPPIARHMIQTTRPKRFMRPVATAASAQRVAVAASGALVVDRNTRRQPWWKWWTGNSNTKVYDPSAPLADSKAKRKHWWKWWRPKPIGAPYPADAAAYDPVAAEKFYSKRPWVVISRLFKLITKTLFFNIRLWLDFRAYSRAGKPEGVPWPNEELRAKEALELATQLGPAFIKLAQALSIRTDLIPEAYALQLRKLQDKVTPFDSDEAKEILARELGVNNTTELNTIFTTLSEEPLAAASIGQVYKGVLKDGRVVAVKVQRPNILDDIALDMHLLRMLAPLAVRFTNAVIKSERTFPQDIEVAKQLVDEWGRGFVAEGDYKCEAANGQNFSEAMVRRELGAVKSPTVVSELTTGKILVTEWIDGTRLDLDASPDVPRLCGVAINAYMTMLLDTGVLHCDPHPGNLLRTRDGKLCILDWGMTIAVPSDLQYSLIEFIAHVMAEDYEVMPNDFVNLGFTPPGQLERLKAANITEGLSFTLRQLVKGGSRKKLEERVREEVLDRIDPDRLLTEEELREKVKDEMLKVAREQLANDGVDGASILDVQNVMEKMQERFREVFKLPPYVLYLARAFATLEGIGLSANDDYAIVSEAFPYLSKRLLTDDNPRTKAALRSMVYGSTDKDPSNANLNLTKMLRLGKGFSSYSQSTSGIDLGSVAGDAASALPYTGDAAAGDIVVSSSSSPPPMKAADDDLFTVLLSRDGNYVQELLLQEAAKFADAAARARIPRWIPSLARPNKTDEDILKAYDKLWEQLAAYRAGATVDFSSAPDKPPRILVPILSQLADPESRLRQMLPLIGLIARRFSVVLLLRVAQRLEEDATRPIAIALARLAAASHRKLAVLIAPPELPRLPEPITGSSAR